MEMWCEIVEALTAEERYGFFLLENPHVFKRHG
jgi:hypothetical protein